jgi:hypothetical protein
MRQTWKRRVSIVGIGLTLGLVLVVATAAGPSNGTADPIERQTTEQRAYGNVGRSARGSREFPTPNPAQYPTPGTPKLTCLDDYATRHTDWCQAWVMKLIRKDVSPYDEDAPILHP